MMYFCRVGIHWQIECPSCEATIRFDRKMLQEDDYICECGYLVLLSEFGIKPLRVVEDDEDAKSA